MNRPEMVVIFLLGAAVGVAWLCCFGLLAMRNPYDRLHAIGPASILPPLLVTAAVFVQSGISQAGFKTLAIAFVLIAVNPIVTHAIARAVRLRESGKLRSEK